MQIQFQGDLTNSSATVVAALGADLSQAVGNTNAFFTVGKSGINYDVGAYTAPVAGGDGRWRVQLAAPYAGATAAGSTCVLHLSFTSSGIAYPDPGDTEWPAIAKRQAQTVDNRLTASVATAVATAQAAISLGDLRSLSRLALVGQADQTTSSQAHGADFALGPGFAEHWSDLSDWNAVGVTVSNGTLVGTSTSGATGAHRALTVQPQGRLRARCTVTLPASTVAQSAAFVLFGVNTAAAGSAPQPGAPNSHGVGFYGDGSTSSFGGGIFLSPDGSNPSAALPAGTYYLTISADEYGLTIYLSDAAHSIERVLILAWASGPNPVNTTAIPAVNNIWVWNSDARGSAGITIGPVGARASSATITPPDGIEIAPYVTTVQFSASDGMRIQLPANYTSRKPSPVILFFHGAGQNEQAPFVDPVSRTFFQQLSAAGFAILSSRGNDVQNWGNQAALDAYFAAYHYYRDHYALGPVCALSESMGGLAGLLTLAGRQFPLLAAWAGIYPVCNLANMYGGGAGTYAGNINTAYGITSSNPYATATNGHDPLLLAQANPSAFRGLPMHFYASYADTVVTRAQNTDALQALIGTSAPESTIITCTGNHGDPSHFQAPDLIAFCQRYLPS